ncbi:MAG: hypothetical protein OXG82_00335 [Gammaproteobacteria bacterium]|nr:hypothetical protein [Gammaproteobacteria bacterium]
MADANHEDKKPIEPGKGKITIWVNGDPRPEEDGRVFTYDEAVRLRFEPKPNHEYSVFVENAVRREDGDFVETDPPVKVQDGTRFNIDETDNT